MKIKILVKQHELGCEISSYGNWIDLRSSETVKLKKNEYRLIDLGISVRLPKYYQANIVPRSGTFKHYGVIQTNHYGVIDGPSKTDQGYSGNNDRWKFGAFNLSNEDAEIFAGDRICQFEIRPTMYAPFWVKIMWLFSSGIEIKYVSNLNSIDRGGFGSTGLK